MNTPSMKVPHSILLVDDDTSLCQLLSEFLSGEGFNVHSINSGEAALDYLNDANNQPSCLVLDIMMPGISGLETLKQLRHFSSVPVIMLTGRGDDIDRILGLEMGPMITFVNLAIQESSQLESKQFLGEQTTLLRALQPINSTFTALPYFQKNSKPVLMESS